MRKFRIKVIGVTDLLMHNGRLANPMDEAKKAIDEAYKAYKKNPTDENFEALARAEFMGGLYYIGQGEPPIGPYWPSENFHACLKGAGAKLKRGRGNLKRPVAAAVVWDDEINPLSYAAFGSGRAPRSAEGLWGDENYRHQKTAKVGNSKVLRTRPVFKSWSFDVTGIIDTEILDFNDLDAVGRTAGQLIGIGDWRPSCGNPGTFGKFRVEVTDLGEYDPLKVAA